MQGGGALPFDSVVRYIETDGKAYIDTGIKTTSSLTFSLNIYIPTHTIGFWVFGSRISASSGVCSFLNDVPTGKRHWFYYDGSNTILTPLQNGYYNFTNRENRGTLFVGNTVTSRTNGTFTSDNNFLILTLNVNGTPAIANIAQGARILPSQIYENGVIARDYIPVRKNGLGYLYDVVSGQLFGNANSEGAFGYGADVPYTEIEYIETDGLSFIDTEIKGSSTASVDLNVYIPNHGTQVFWVFGSRNGANSGQLALINDPTYNNASYRFNNATVNSSYMGEGIHTIKTFTNNIYIDGVHKNTSSGSFTGNYNMHLLTLNVNGTPAIPNIASGARLYPSLICSDMNVARVYKPVKVNGEGYLFDYISGALFGNANSEGAFLLGNNKIR